MAKKYLSVNLTGEVEEHVRGEAKRLNISYAAFVSMTISQTMSSQGISSQVEATCLSMTQVKPVQAQIASTCGTQHGASYGKLRLEDLGAL